MGVLVDEEDFCKQFEEESVLFGMFPDGSKRPPKVPNENQMESAALLED